MMEANRITGKFIYKNLQRSLQRGSFTRKVGMKKRDMQTLMEELKLQDLADALAELFRDDPETGETPIDCEQILHLCRPYLVEAGSRFHPGFKEPAGGWLDSIYRRILLWMYPKQGAEMPGEESLLPELLFCEVFHVMLELDRQRRQRVIPDFDFQFLSEEEASQFPAGKEYMRFMKLSRDYYLYEFLVIGKMLQPFNTLGHIAGVHYVAMHMARQLRRNDVPVDLAMVSAASAAHDIGKFGCREEEIPRIPHLHYYYTDELLLRMELPGIAHIASNHSTWDLELENLSCENLLLIYADFRVKSSRDENGREEIRFYSLRQAFDVILGKLENVDQTKHDRYVRVYRKLRDFEDYMVSLGVRTELDEVQTERLQWTDASLLDAHESVVRLKHLAIDHNIDVMHRFGSVREFGDLLENARSEKQWENIRAYIGTIEEYFTYLSEEQKYMAVHFLQELLVQRGGDIRRQAAVLIGKIIACYDEEYRKDLPNGATLPEDIIDSRKLWEEHLAIVTEPDLQRTERQQRWMGYSLKFTFQALLEYASETLIPEYIGAFMELLRKHGRTEAMMFILLDTVLEIPFDVLHEENIRTITGFCEEAMERSEPEIKVAALRIIRKMAEAIQREEKDGAAYPQIANRLATLLTYPVEGEYQISAAFLKERTAEALRLSDSFEAPAITEADYTAMFRDDLRIDTPWVVKAVNIEVMLDRIMSGQQEEVFYTAAHFSNLLKVSERVTIRHEAGRGLILIFDRLTREQKHEIVVELMRGLEIGDYQFSRYIPEYLGILITKLHPDEQTEVMKDIQQLLYNVNEKVVSVTLDTLGVILQNANDEDSDRCREIIGMLLMGMANYHRVVSQEAFQVLGRSVFGSELLSLQQKAEIFVILCKKMLTLIEDRKGDMLRFFSNASSLNHVYRFISDYQFFCGELPLQDMDKAAFFPGTFDPFSLGHKGIVTAIRDAGYEVYLALDEFSWSKNTQPRQHRRRIMNMTCADLIGTYIFPDDQPINIANPSDIRRLRRLLPGKELYMVVGSDVIANASSYRNDPEPDSIHGMNHIVFQREGSERDNTSGRSYQEGRSKIRGEVIELTLPPHLEDISSTKIRDNIDENRDIASLIDPVVQNYIYDNALYLRQPMYKYILSARDLRFQSDRSGGVLHSVSISDGAKDGAVVAEAFVHPVETRMLYEEFGNQKLASFIRERAPGNTLVLDRIWADSLSLDEDSYQLILTETLSEALKDDYTYAIYHEPPNSKKDKKLIDVLLRQGFKEIMIDGAPSGCYGVDMRSPVTLIQNMSTVLKSPLNKNPRVEKVLRKAHTRLQQSLTEMFPDTLVLSYNSLVMHNKLVQMITEENGVPSEEGEKRVLGPYMCVPFGKILNHMAVPNTVTKTLHLEKSFSPDLSSFRIKEYPNYAGIEDQVRTIRSFRRSAILVDDILHKGYRMQRLDPVLTENGVHVHKLLVGILSGNGKDLMAVQKRSVDSVYFLPNLKAWFVESSLYPFIGGDGVERHTGTIDDDFTAINLILPYVLPKFLSNQCSKAAIYNFSMVCLENARDILKTLEEEYQKEYQRKLTLQRLPEVVNAPKLTDVGQCLDFDRALAASTYVEDDIERLQRLKGLI
ncbi:MAG: hypothetical protein K6B42_01345 [Clostridia bacterium]|nr:hypothetical protein [Clostridia bacterium]